MKKYILLSLLVPAFMFGKAQTITMDTFSNPDTSLCGGDSFYVYFTATGSFNVPNYFAVQLSDATGDFASATVISDSVPASADSILAFVPVSLAQTSSNYLVRVVSTNPAVASNDNGTGLNIYIYPQTPTINLSSINNCLGTATLSANTPNNTRVIWYVNGTNIYSTLTGAYQPIYAGAYTAQLQQGYCYSNMSDTVIVSPLVTASVSLSSTAIACYGTPFTFTAHTTHGGISPTYQWYQNGILQSSTDTFFTSSNVQNNDSIMVVLSSDAVCVSDSQTVAGLDASVYPLIPAPTITASGHGCLGADSITMAATGPFEVLWYLNGAEVDSSLRAYTVAGGPADTQLGFPYSVVLDASGNIYVSDPGNGWVLKFPPGSTSSTNGEVVAYNGLNTPLGICLDRSGNLYVADIANDAVLKYPAGSDSTTVGVVVAGNPNEAPDSTANTFNSPISVFVDSSGYIYVGDNYNNRVQKFPPGSDSLTNGVTVAKYQIGGINDIYLDKSGNIYVSDYHNNWVWKFPAGGDSATLGTIVAAHQLNEPVGVFTGSKNNLYVMDDGNNRVLQFAAGSDSATVGTTVAGGNGAGSARGQLQDAGNIFVDSSGDIYITDGGNDRVQEWIPGAPDTIYVPAAAGSYTGIYQTATGVCPSLVSDTITISTPPVVSLSWDLLVQEHDLYGDDGDTGLYIPCYPLIFPLSGGLPLGGTYSGAYVSNDTINLSSWFGSPNKDTVFYTCTNANGCTAQAEDSFSVNFCEGVKEIPPSSISLYPNPNTGAFVLESNGEEGKQYIITDMLGRVLAQETITGDKQNIMLQNIAAGIYTLEIKDGNSPATRFTVTK